jgi:hypothetical protein
MRFRSENASRLTGFRAKEFALLLWDLLGITFLEPSARNDRPDHCHDLLCRSLDMPLQQLHTQLGITLAARIDECHVLLMGLLPDGYLHSLEPKIVIAAIVQYAQHLERNIPLTRQI